MQNNDNPLWRIIWPLMASVAGSITALSFRPFKRMSLTEVTLALIVGTSFAMFVGPWAARLFFGSGPMDIRMVGALFYLMASGSNILIPLAVKKLSGFLGVDNTENVQ